MSPIDIWCSTACEGLQIKKQIALYNVKPFVEMVNNTGKFQTIFHTPSTRPEGVELSLLNQYLHCAAATYVFMPYQ